MTTFDGERFRNPAAIDRPVPFYSWNERMEPEELRRQIELIAQGGWGGAFVHSRIGLTTPYLGEEWFTAVEAAIDECQKQGLKVWLYDEDKWPSGFSGGTVPLADPAFRVQTLIARPADQPAPPDCEPLGSAQDGLQLYVWTAPLGHDWFNGTCYTGLMHREAMQKFLEDAYEPYHKRFGGLYGETIVGEFTDEPCSIFRIRLPHGSVPYTPELLERFGEMHGYSPLEHLHLLYHSDGPEASRFRLHYFRTVNDLFERNFSKQLGDWCQEHGIALTGHYMCEDSLYAQQVWGVKVMPNYRHEGIPGIDHLCRHVGNVITPKQCQSVVNQYGKPRMLSEIYGVDGGSLTFEDRAWIAGEQMCLGVNLLNPHLSLYTMAGCRKRDYPQNIFYQQPWWPLNRLIDEPLSRVCYSLSLGKYVAEALVIHPGESTFVHWQTALDPEKFEGLLDSDWQPVVPEAKQRIDKLDVEFKRVLDVLLGAQRTFDLGDETILANVGEVSEVNGKPCLRVNMMDYPLVILPSMTTIALSTVDLLEQFMHAGGTMLRCGEAPTLLEGEPDKRLEQFLSRIPEVTPEQLPARLGELVAPAVEVKGITPAETERLYVHVRDLEDGDRLVYLVNLNRMLSFDAQLLLRGSYRSLWQLDITSGEQNELTTRAGEQGMELVLPFAPAQMHLLRLSPKVPSSSGVSLLPGKTIEQYPLAPSQWEIERIDENAVTLDFALWKTSERDWSPKAAPVIGVQEYLNSIKYDGALTLRYPVQVHDLSPERKVHLVVEYPERYSIRVNDQPVAYAGLPAWRDFRWMPIDITGLLHEGENAIEMHCEKFQHGDLAIVEDAFARYGTEIESIYLIGNFSVTGKPNADKPVAGHWQEFGLPPIGVQCFEQGEFVLSDPAPLSYGDTTLQGLPFYAGRLKLSADLPELGDNGRWFLTIDKLDCPIAEVAVENNIIGYLMTHPLEVEVTDAVRAGGKSISITLYSTLRNLLGPHHHPEGELAAVGPPAFSASAQHDAQGANTWVINWAEGKETPGWADRYCMVSFGDLGEIKLVRRAG